MSYPDELVPGCICHLWPSTHPACPQHGGPPRAFVLHRHEDETGVSGVGVVAEGVEFSDGTVALRWTSAWPTSVVFHEKGIESVLAVHGHGGKTTIEWRPS